MWNCKIAHCFKHANCNVICKSAVCLCMWNCDIASNSQILFSTAESNSLRDPHEVSTGKTFTVSSGWYGNNPFWVTVAAASTMPPSSTLTRRSAPRSSLALLLAIPLLSAAAASPTCSCPMPASTSHPVPHNRTEREALAERYYQVLSVINTGLWRHLPNVCLDMVSLPIVSLLQQCY